MLRALKEKLKWLDPFTYVDKFVLPKIEAAPKKIQLLVFFASYAALLILVSLITANPPMVFVFLSAVYAYLYFFEKSESVKWSVYLLSAFLFAFVLYNFVLAFLLGSNAPLMIVYSGSMEPTLYRGDIVLLSGSKNFSMGSAALDFAVAGKTLSDFAEVGYSINAFGRLRPSALKISGNEYGLDFKGPIVVYYSPLLKRDIIHRGVLLLHASDGNFLITLGDNNNRIDEDCGKTGSAYNCITVNPVSAGSVKGVYLFHVPLIGYAKLLIFDDLPWFFNCLGISLKGKVDLLGCAFSSPDQREALSPMNGF